MLRALVEGLLEDFGCADFCAADVAEVCPLCILVPTIFLEQFLSVLYISLHVILWVKVRIDVHLGDLKSAKVFVIPSLHLVEQARALVRALHELGGTVAVKRHILLSLITQLTGSFNFHLLVLEVILVVEVVIDLLQFVKHGHVE